MSDQDQQQIPIYDAQAPSEESKRLKALFEDMERRQLDALDESSKNIIERIATFLGILFGISVLSNNFPPPYLKGNSLAKIMIIVSLAFFLLSIAAGIGTQARSYSLYRYNVTEMRRVLAHIVQQKMFWLRMSNLLFALGVVALAVLLIVIIWSL